MNMELYVFSKNQIFEISQFLVNTIILKSERKGVPTTLTFDFCRDLVVQNNLNLTFFEGDKVEFTVNGNKIFVGYIFSKNRDKEQVISVKCYDQLRYLKNKQSYTYVNKTASQLINLICKDFNLKTGNLTDTKYKILARDEDNKELIDIILNALDITFINTKQLYIFYDDLGYLKLSKLEDMVIDYVITEDFNLIDFNYTTDIDSDTYNQVKLYIDDKDTKNRNVYIAKDSKNQGKWGILQYYESVEDTYNESQIKELAKVILSIKNKVKETFSIEVIGTGLYKEEKIRAGNTIFVKMDSLAETGVNSAFVIESCKHTFSNNEHLIELELIR